MAENNDLKKFNRQVINQGKQLIYPIDSAGDQFYPECIKFTVYKRLGASLKAIQKSLGDIGSTFMAGMGLDDKSVEEKKELLAATVAQRKMLHKSNKEANRDEIAKLKEKEKFLNDVISGDASVVDVLRKGGVGKKLGAVIEEATAGMRQKTFNQLQTTEEKTSQLGEIFMNMPNEITFAEENSWEGADLGMVGGLVKGDVAQGGVSGAFSNFANIVGGGTGALAAHAMKISGGAAVGAVLGVLGGTGLQKSLESGTGQIANPYKEMTFSGIGFREFSFNFIFRARNEKEVNMVQEIIRTFRYYSKPVYTHGKSGFLSYPEEFHVEFLVKNSNRKHGPHRTIGTEKDHCDYFINNPYIPEIKMCVLKTVNTNFAAQNAWRSLENGAPVEISLALTFMETELVTGEDVIGDTKVGRFVETGRKF